MGKDHGWECSSKHVDNALKELNQITTDRERTRLEKARLIDRDKRIAADALKWERSPKMPRVDTSHRAILDPATRARYEESRRRAEK